MHHIHTAYGIIRLQNKMGSSLGRLLQTASALADVHRCRALDSRAVRLYKKQMTATGWDLTGRHLLGDDSRTQLTGS